MEGGRSRDNLLPLDDFGTARDMNPETLAEYRAVFSEPAKEVAREEICDYATNLIEIAIAAKKQTHGALVSEADVQEASRFLNRRGKDGHKELWGVLGGIFLGGGLSAGLSMLLDQKYPPEGVFTGMALTGLGCFCIALVLGDSFPSWKLLHRRSEDSSKRRKTVVRRKPPNSARS